MKRQKATREDKTATKNKMTRARTEKKKSRRILGTLTKIFFVVVIIAITVLAYLTLTSSPTVNAPDVTDSSLSEAKTTIKSPGLKVGAVRKVPNDTVESGYVIKTGPTADSSKKEGLSVDIYVSKGSSRSKIKDYIGQGYQTAIKGLVNDYGVSESQIEVEEVSTSGYGEGVIISQTPSGGETFKVSSGDKITFRVTIESTVTVPNLTGYTYSEATAALTALGVSSSHITVYQTDPNSSTSYVQASSPSSTATVTAQTPYHDDTLSGSVVLYLATDEEESSQAPSSSSLGSSKSKESSSSSSSTDDSGSSTKTSDE